ncbi:hypothetical protein [Paracidovorax wautersii]|uniref:Uncharacterized protein n=1 Tax=Paracidovorax wautersii TaxID=1177982 RepID=A0ABU1I7M4_9BURK|nr:hypothetical protein [Paracidovorax wautersii]MDR6213205.1 hypothetical protein [Paracidovorax wautersii]
MVVVQALHGNPFEKRQKAKGAETEIPDAGRMQLTGIKEEGKRKWAPLYIQT